MLFGVILEVWIRTRETFSHRVETVKQNGESREEDMSSGPSVDLNDLPPSHLSELIVPVSGKMSGWSAIRCFYLH